MPEKVRPIAALLAPLARSLRHKALEGALADLKVGNLTRAFVRLQSLPFKHGDIQDACKMLLKAGA